MASRDLPTYQDLTDRLLDIFDLDRAASRDLRMARAAVLTAYRDMHQRAHWSYYDRQCVVLTVAPYETGTVAYDHTGGASERQLTLTDGTWPTWAASGRVIIDDVHYDVESRVSSTIITLGESSNPGADVASGTTYTIYRSAYDLPSDFSKVRSVWNSTLNEPITPANIDSQNFLVNSDGSSTSSPCMYSIASNADYVFKDALQINPPDAAYAINVAYTAQPRAMSLEQYATGTASVSADSVTVTGSGTTFVAGHVGCVIRFSSSGTTMPTNAVGYRDSNVDNPAVHQAIVKSVASTTSITIDSASPSALSAVKFTISDRLDVQPGVMLTALEKLAAWEMARLCKRDDVDRYERQAMSALRLAMENNQRSDDSQTGWRRSPFVNASITTEG